MLPTLFVSHGAPTLLIDGSPAHHFLKTLGENLDRPSLVLCISAHWEADQPRLNGTLHLKTIHDFSGFPQELYEANYSAAGNPEVAQRAVALLKNAGFDAKLDPSRGLDHGAWVPLKLMYPRVDIPIIQLSVQTQLGPDHHLSLGQVLRPLRQEGVLILGSGGATHNLREFRGQPLETPPPDYVRAFDEWLFEKVVEGDKKALLNYRKNAPSGVRNHPTAEHFLPLFVALGAADHQDGGRRLHHSFSYGILSMAAYAWD